MLNLWFLLFLKSYAVTSVYLLNCSKIPLKILFLPTDYSVSASRASCNLGDTHSPRSFLWRFSCGRNHNEINFRFRRDATNATKVNCLIAALLNFIKIHMLLDATRPRAYQWGRRAADSHSQLPLIDCTFASCSLRRA